MAVKKSKNKLRPLVIGVGSVALTILRLLWAWTISMRKQRFLLV